MEYERRDDDKNEAHYLTREQVRLLMSHPFEKKRMDGGDSRHAFRSVSRGFPHNTLYI